MSGSRAKVTWGERLIIVVCFAIAVVIVDPRGNFPLNDDWDFALATFRFASSGHFAFTPYTAVSLRAQVLWGALWTVAAGASWTVLRCSTLTLSLASLLLFAELMALGGSRRSVRLLGVAALAANPIFFWSSFTYMTQVPFAFCGIVAMYAAARGLRERSLAWLTFSSVAVCASFMIRQTGVVNALPALVLLALYRHRWDPRWKAAIAMCAAPVAIFAVAAITTGGLAGSPRELHRHYQMWTEGTFTGAAAVTVAWHYLFFNAQNFALFFAGISWLAVRKVRTRASATLLMAIVAMFISRAYALSASGHPLPYFAIPWCCDILNGNILSNFSLGPLTLSDVWSGRRDFAYVLPFPLRIAATFLFAAIGAAVVHQVLQRAAAVRERVLDEDTIPMRLATVHVIAATAILAASGAYFDRYSLDSTWAVPLILVPLATSQRQRMIAFALTFAIALFSLFATQEYLRWNRARWAAVEELRASGVPPRQIDGGSEYRNLLIGFQPLTRGEISRYIDPRFVIAFGELDGYRTMRRRDVTSFGGLRHFSVLTLQRME